MAQPVNSIADVETVTIASGQSLSDPVHLVGRVIIGLYIPASWTAAGITFQASHDGVQWFDAHYDDGVEVLISTSAGNYFGIQRPDALFGVRQCRLRSGTSASPIVQAADRDVILMTGAPN